MVVVKHRAGRNWRPILALLTGAVLAAAMSGCRNEDDITRTTEPKARQAKTEEPKSEKVATRILGVIAPGEDGDSWFFKLMGPAEKVGSHETEFDAFLVSIEFSKNPDKPVTWAPPEGWREGPRKDRYATILIGAGEEPLELSVMPAGGSLLDNVNRWRDQLGLGRIKADELPSSAKEVTTKQGTKVMRVDLTGTAGKGPAMPPFMKGR